MTDLSIHNMDYPDIDIFLRILQILTENFIPEVTYSFAHEGSRGRTC